MRARSAAIPALFAACFVAMGLFLALRLEFDSGVTHFLSRTDRADLASVSAQIADAPLTRTMILSITGTELSNAIAAARAWSTILADHPEVASLRSGPDPDLAGAIYDLYFPQRHLLLSDDPEV